MTELNAQQLLHFQQKLQALSVQLRQLLSGQEDKAKPVILDQQSVGRVSRIDAIAQQQMLKANVKQTEQRLALVLAALKRFAEDEYGYCMACDEIIAIARLEIKPEAQYCIKCQEQFE